MDNSTTEIVTLNMEAIRQTARTRYMTARKQKRSFRGWIEASVPGWIVIIFLAVFVLSAPHTTAMFNMITPGVGFMGVLLVESGLLFIAFRRKMERQKGGKLSGIYLAFEGLLFFAAVIVNGAGALIAVVSVTGLAAMSSETILATFGSLPIPTQVGLILVPFAAVLIPIGTIVTGEGFATYILEGQQAERDLETDWENHEQLEVYREAFSHLLHQGVNARDANRRAGSATTNFYQAGLTIEIPALMEDDSVRMVSAATPRTQKRLPSRTTSRQKQSGRNPDARSAVRAYLEEHPEASQLSVRDLAAVSGVGRTIASEELSAYKGRNHSKIDA